MPYHHLTSFDRGKIEACLAQGMSRTAIAEQLNRPLCTICRELDRSSTATGYRAQRAQQRYEERRMACRPQRKMDHAPLRAYVIGAICEQGWTPEQIAGRLPIDHPDEPRMRISHEAIYQAIYGQESLHFLRVFLPQERPKRRRRGQGRTRRGSTILNRVGIEQRPAHIEQRQEPGHWEGDTVVGKGQDGFIVTLVERTARLVHAVKTATKTAVEVATATIETLLDRPISWVKTITFDNGTEFAHHEHIAAGLGVDIYFAAPYSAYQRGTNENTNGLIRRYLPKRTSFASLTQRQLDAIVDLLNNRPRKCLAYQTPNEVFLKQRATHLLALSS